VQTAVVTATGRGSGWVDVATLETTVGTGWEPVAPAPEAVIYHDLVAYGGETFLLGGVGESGTPITPSRKYSPTADAWYDLAPEPAPEIARPLDACVSENGAGDPVIVLFPTDDTVTDVHIYDIQGDAWYTAPYTSPLPAGGIAGAAVVSDIERNVCYLSGGQASGGVTHTLYAYDVVSNTAASLPAMTTPRVFHAAWLYDGMVCVGGGGSGFPPVTGLDSTQCYSITGETWLPENDTLGPLPYPAWAMADAQGEREGVPQLWMMGGVRTFGPGMIEAEPRTAYWDAGTQSWMLAAPLLQPVYLAAGAAQGETVYVAGGSEGGAGFVAGAFHERLAQCSTPRRVYLPVILREE
jgi:hypothetical protein